MRLKLLFGVLLLTGCASGGNKELLKDRFVKLDKLSTFRVKTCQLETTLSEPMKIKYLQLYPSEHTLLQQGEWNYKWTVMESRCELVQPQKSHLMQSHKAILNAAMCTLLQAYWVNSPFDEMRLESDQIEDREDVVFIHKGGQDLGVSVFKRDFLIETNTKKLGTLRAHYALNNGDWLPDWLEQKFHNSTVRVDQITYTSSNLNGRPMVDSFWISVGEGEPSAHTSVKVTKCL